MSIFDDSIDWKNDEYKNLESGIRQLVKSLHKTGIRTEMSCEGHIREKWYYTGVLPYPWVIIKPLEKQLAKIKKLLKAWNKQNPENKWILTTERIHGSYTPDYIEWKIKEREPFGTVFLALTPEEENNTLSKKKLTALQKTVNELAKFFLSKTTK